MNEAPILIITNENWEGEIYKTIWEDLRIDNDLQIFDNAEEALVFIAKIKVRPFLIISDVKLPGIDGYEFKEKLGQDPVLKCKHVPFIFRSIIDLDEQIKHAYDLGANGYFIKGAGIDEVRRNISTMIEYWRLSKTPKG